MSVPVVLRDEAQAEFDEAFDGCNVWRNLNVGSALAGGLAAMSAHASRVGRRWLS
jgi:hypothetical protein